MGNSVITLLQGRTTAPLRENMAERRVPLSIQDHVEDPSKRRGDRFKMVCVSESQAHDRAPDPWVVYASST